MLTPWLEMAYIFKLSVWDKAHTLKLRQEQAFSQNRPSNKRQQSDAKSWLLCVTANG